MSTSCTARTPASACSAPGSTASGVLFLGGGGVFIANGFLAESFFSTHLHIEITWWIWGALALLIAVGLNHLGVRLAIRGVLALACISLIPFVILAVSIIAQGGDAGNTLSVFGTSHARAQRRLSTASCSRSRCSSASRPRRRSARKPTTRTARSRLP